MNTYKILESPIESQVKEGVSVEPIKKLQVTKEETIVTVKEYDYDFLISQREAIQKQADDFAQARQVELDEVNELIAQCEQMGIKPIDTISNININGGNK